MPPHARRFASLPVARGRDAFLPAIPAGGMKKLPAIPARLVVIGGHRACMSIECR